jgi:hypothetical protein
MRTRVSSKSSGQLIFIIIWAAFTIWQTIVISTEDDKKPLIILIPIFLFFLVQFLKVRILSYDGEFVYLNGLRKEHRLDYSEIIKVKRVLGRFYEGNQMNFGYTLIYKDQNGKKRSCHFYIPLSNIPIWTRFKVKMIENNPLIEIVE